MEARHVSDGRPNFVAEDQESGTLQTQHDAMTAYETRVQRAGNRGGTEGQKKARTAKRRHTKTNKTEVGREPTIM